MKKFKKSAGSLMKYKFKCTDKSCKICSLYVNQGSSFLMSNKMR